MITLMRRILAVSGDYQGRIKLALVFSFFKSILAKAPIGFAFFALAAFYHNTATVEMCLQIGLALAACLLLQMLFHHIADRLQSAAGFLLFAEKRMEFGRHLRKMPMGYFTVGQGGATLSGGEKQRISIARCILKDAPIVILDEATASVDADNESHIQQAISELCAGKTLLVIAHRLNTIRHADKILVIADGRITQQGTHEELMQKSGIYKNFVAARKKSKGWGRRS